MKNHTLAFILGLLALFAIITSCSSNNNGTVQISAGDFLDRSFSINFGNPGRVAVNRRSFKTAVTNASGAYVSLRFSPECPQLQPPNSIGPSPTPGGIVIPVPGTSTGSSPTGGLHVTQRIGHLNAQQARTILATLKEQADGNTCP